MEEVRKAVGGDWVPGHRLGIWWQEPVVLSVLQLHGCTSCCVRETGFIKQVFRIGSFSSLCCHHKSLIFCVRLGFFLYLLKGTNCSDIGHYKSIKWLEGRQSHVGQRKQFSGQNLALSQSLAFIVRLWQCERKHKCFSNLVNFSQWAVTCWHF